MLEQPLHMKRNQGKHYIHPVVFHTLPKLAAVCKATVCIRHRNTLTGVTKGLRSSIDGLLGYVWSALSTPSPLQVGGRGYLHSLPCQVRGREDKTEADCAGAVSENEQ